VRVLAAAECFLAAAQKKKRWAVDASVAALVSSCKGCFAIMGGQWWWLLGCCMSSFGSSSMNAAMQDVMLQYCCSGLAFKVAQIWFVEV
jgi:hypothetical protein